ncbi:MAG: DUF3793 family protein [Endomicrobium sp.]|jgi:hypothetical protein|nr:DUF3793 family protein [Endomicrobium sp.]
MEFYTIPEINKVLIEYCAPVLLRRKPAALFTLPSKQYLSLLKQTIKNALNIKVLRIYQKGILVMIYDYILLESLLLKNESIHDALLLFGYSSYTDIDDYLCHLKNKFQNGSIFPHEIGLFLGYPPEDVFAFIHNKGQAYKYCGIWKVYSDEEYSRKCFEEYKYCAECLRKHLSNGGRIENFKTIYGIQKTGGSIYE